MYESRRERLSFNWNLFAVWVGTVTAFVAFGGTLAGHIVGPAFLVALGLELGIVQWFVLRRTFAISDWWPVLSAFAWVAGGIVGSIGGAIFSTPYAGLPLTPLAIALFGMLGGGTLGGAQWWLLRRRIAGAGWWAPAAALGLGCGALAGYYLISLFESTLRATIRYNLGPLVGFDLSLALTELVPFTLMSLAIGFFLSLTTGLVLAMRRS